jgi:divalent metal cation (Fe/Co/Zn/Cd) transporter
LRLSGLAALRGGFMRQRQGGIPSRDELVARALRLVTASVAFGALSGTVSVISGLRAGSLGVLAVGLGVLADVTGSAVLIWRFRAERRRPGSPHAGEARAAMIVAAALAVVAVVLAAESAAALASGSHPGSSAVTLASAAVSLAVLAPLAVAKRRTGRRMGSRALMGDGALSGIGAGTSLLALAALVLYDALGWWWADRVAALAVAVIAAAEAWHTMPRPGARPPS